MAVDSRITVLLYCCNKGLQRADLAEALRAQGCAVAIPGNFDEAVRTIRSDQCPNLCVIEGTIERRSQCGGWRLADQARDLGRDVVVIDSQGNPEFPLVKWVRTGTDLDKLASRVLDAFDQTVTA